MRPSSDLLSDLLLVEYLIPRESGFETKIELHRASISHRNCTRKRLSIVMILSDPAVGPLIQIVQSKWSPPPPLYIAPFLNLKFLNLPCNPFLVPFVLIHRSIVSCSQMCPLFGESTVPMWVIEITSCPLQWAIETCTMADPKL